MDQDRDITATFAAAGVVASDDFNRANETPLAGGRELAEVFERRVIANLTGNQVAGVSGDALYYWQGPGTFSNSEQFSRVKVTNASGQVGLVLLGTSNSGVAGVVGRRDALHLLVRERVLPGQLDHGSIDSSTR